MNDIHITHWMPLPTLPDQCPECGGSARGKHYHLCSQYERNGKGTLPDQPESKQCPECHLFTRHLDSCSMGTLPDQCPECGKKVKPSGIKEIIKGQYCNCKGTLPEEGE